MESEWELHNEIAAEGTIISWLQQIFNLNSGNECILKTLTCANDTDML